MGVRELRVEILGPLQIFTGVDAVAVSAPKHRALLALLALRPGYSATTEQLIDGLWGEDPPRSAQKTLQTYVSGLRRILTGDAIRTSGGGYELTIAPENIDAHRFEALVGSARKSQAAHQTEEAIDSLRGALDLWRGPALADVLSELPDTAAASRLDELRRVAVEDLADLLLESGQDRELIPDLETAVSEEPMRERRWAQLMTALYRSGRQADALRTFQRLKTLLGEELGIEPSAELVQLEKDILLQDSALTADSTSDTRSHRLLPDDLTRTNNLPVQTSSFVGRDKELGEVKKMLEENRLVTLVGAGGAGKTRLAMEVGYNSPDLHPDGTWLVELASLDDSNQVDSQVLKSLGLRESADTSTIETILDTLRSRSMLLVMDNCEHLIDPCATLLDQLLRSCRELRILATSREPIGIRGEAIYRVPSLSYPDENADLSTDHLAKYGAVQLFVERAVSHDRQFALQADNAESISEICRRIDGIPLAIELAAARLRTLSVHTVSDRLADRFKLLTGGDRTQLPRQQTLRALIDWSYELLNVWERTVLRRLSIFVDGFELDVAEQVCAGEDLDVEDVFDLVNSLINKSLVQIEPYQKSHRYRLLETVREYAYGMMQLTDPEDLDKTREAHSKAYLGLALEAESDLDGPNQLRWLNRIETEDPNIRAAISHLLSADVTALDALRLVCGLEMYWKERSGSPRDLPMMESILAHPAAQGPNEERVTLLLIAAHCQFNRLGNTNSIGSLIDEAMVLLVDINSPLLLSNLISFSALYGNFYRGDVDSAFKQMEDAELTAKSTNNPNSIALVLRRKAALQSLSDHLYEAVLNYERSLSHYRSTGNRIGVAFVLGDMANCDMMLGNFSEALLHLGEAVEIELEYKLIHYLSADYANLGLLGALVEDWEACRTHATSALYLSTRSGNRRGYAYGILLLALYLSATGRLQEAAQIHGAGELHISDELMHNAPIERGLRIADVARLREGLGDAQFEDAWATGRTLVTLDDILGIVNMDA